MPTCVVTGGSSGIGAATAVAFATRGYRVVVVGRDEERLAAVAAKTGGRYVVANLQSRDACERVADEIGGDVDVLVNNAGVVSGKRFLESSAAEVEAVMSVNLLAPMWLTRVLLPRMVARNAGTVVFISSAAGIVGTSGLADYSASKFGLVGFAESLRMELARQSSAVAVSTVCPYFTRTAMFDGVKPRLQWLAPMLEPEDVADAVVDAVDNGKPVVLLPRALNLVPLARGILPTQVFDFLQDWTGTSRNMDSFRGRSRL